MSAFEWYASLVISPPIPSNESWTCPRRWPGFHRRHADGSRARAARTGGQPCCRRFSITLSTPTPCPGGGRYEAGHRLGSDRQQECRLPFASTVSSVLILTDAELDRGRSTVLHLTSNLSHSALSSVKFWAK